MPCALASRISRSASFIPALNAASPRENSCAPSACSLARTYFRILHEAAAPVTAPLPSPISHYIRRLSPKLFLLKEMVVRDLRPGTPARASGWSGPSPCPILWMLLYTVVFA